LEPRDPSRESETPRELWWECGEAGDDDDDGGGESAHAVVAAVVAAKVVER
jgi:hypothetical protein